MISAIRAGAWSPRLKMEVVVTVLFCLVLAVSGCSKTNEAPSAAKNIKGHKTIGVPAHKMPGDAAHSSSGISNFNKAVMLSRHKQYDEAIKEYLLHLKAHPKSAAAYNNIGFAYYDKKDLDKAIENHKKSLELNPELANGYFGLALAYEKKGDKKKALANWKEFTKRADPSSKWHKKAMEHIKELTKNKKQKTH